MTTRHKSRQRLRTIWRIPDDLWVEFQALLVTVPRGATPHRLRRHLYPVADDRTQSPERRSNGTSSSAAGASRVSSSSGTAYAGLVY